MNPPTLDLGDFVVFVDSCEDVWLQCLACRRDVGNGSGLGPLRPDHAHTPWPRLETLDDFVDAARAHQCDAH